MGARPVIATGAALALALAVPNIARYEGKRNDPYKDLAGIPTVCYGETRVPMRHYTDAECLSLLNKAVKHFQGEVLKCSPELANRPYQLAATTSLAYNIGAKRYCSSTVAKRFKQGNWLSACENFKSWVYVGKVKKQGLVNRRADEYRLCISHV